MRACTLPELILLNHLRQREKIIMVAKVAGLARLTQSINALGSKDFDDLADAIERHVGRIGSAKAALAANVEKLSSAADTIEGLNAAFGNGGPAGPLPGSETSPPASDPH